MVTIPPPILRRRSEPLKPAAGPAINVNVTQVFLSIDGGIVMIFDGPVTVDPDNPPTTWSFNGQTWLQTGCINYGTSVYLILNGPVNPGNAVIIAADDPAARTPSGEYVNAVSLTVADM